jgi:hypothetical protein
MIFWQIIPVINSQKKTKKYSKNRLLGPMSRSKLCENGPEIVDKKNTVAQSTPDVTPRKNKKVRSVRGTICRGLLVLLKIFLSILFLNLFELFTVILLILDS